MEDSFKEYLEKLKKQMESLSPDKANVLSNFKRPFFYLKIKRVLGRIEKRIREYEPLYSLPKMKIRLSFKEELSASCRINIQKREIILRVSIRLKNRKGIKELERSIAHELMHLWIGLDLPTGKTINLPQYEPLIKNIGFYRGRNYPLRYKLCCFLHQQVIIGKIGQKLMHIDGYDDMWFTGGRNPFVNFEEMLVVYAVMKLFKDTIDYYPFLKKAFEENYDDKKLLLFIDKEMPHIRLAIEKLVNEF